MSLSFEVGRLLACVVEIDSCEIPSEFVYFHSFEIFGLTDLSNIRIGWSVRGEGESDTSYDSSHDLQLYCYESNSTSD